MSSDSPILRHPSSIQLMEYAESLVDNDAPVCALIASHVSRCPECAAEVRAIRHTLKVSTLSQIPEAENSLVQAILLQARKEAAADSAKTERNRWFPVLRGAACFAGIILLGMLSFSAALHEGSKAPSIALQAEARPIPAPENGWNPVRPFHGSVVQALAASVAGSGDGLSRSADAGYRRMVDFLDQDLDAATAALQRNPGCVRATQILDAEAKKRLEGLRTLFIDRTL
ncbi:MAG TPA: hypothetical protein PLZ53_03435 [Candidatus Hydrogenedentes bacterium]|jgi:hypothetical protein|nr:hypothetical protein [Candidatus Hydrogenedentota bacterium]HOH42143.1 hypothetical protein [Candidatus Hydrogenedentota bacterium]HQB01828.1 hypothetical protein [Candidatus Hydrogenedentota bacterium]